MLVYHPAYDSYHCITRILKILTCLSEKEYSMDRIRIYDYYILFINDIKNITLPRELSKFKRLVQTTKYNSIENPKYVFNQLEKCSKYCFPINSIFWFYR